MATVKARAKEKEKGKIRTDTTIARRIRTSPAER